MLPQLAVAGREVLRLRITQVIPENMDHNAAVEGGIPDIAEVRSQKERILADPLFCGSRRLCNLLDYIVENTISRNTENLKERIIGIEVFGRSPDYYTSADPSVRVAAGSVRKRLAQYYEQPEHGSELRIEIPVGSYLAEFGVPGGKAETSRWEANPPLEGSAEAGTLIAAPNPHRRGAMIAAVFVVLLAVAASLVYFGRKPSTLDLFWAPVLMNSERLDIFIGAPPDPKSLPQPPKGLGTGQPLETDQLTQVGASETNAAFELAGFLRGKGRAVDVLPTPAVREEKAPFKSSILFGRFRQERMAELSPGLRLRFRKDDAQALRWIEDASDPSNRQWSLPLFTPDDRLDHDFAVISRVQEKTTGRWWVGVAGLTVLGTMVANRLLTDPQGMASIGAHFPAEWERKNLQILIEIKLDKGIPGDVHVVAVRSW